MPTRRNSHGRPKRRRLEAQQRAEARAKRTDAEQAALVIERTAARDGSCLFGECEHTRNQRELSRLNVEVIEVAG